MKKIEAIVKPFKLGDIKEALADLGIDGMTVSEVSRYDHQKSHTGIYRGSEYSADFLPKIKVEIVVSDLMADRALRAIIDAAKTAKTGDGKVFISDVEEVIRIRTGERGDVAL